jgi:catechol 2,3-dioxygenase-like lactoylglutathione lyase family enzyme
VRESQPGEPHFARETADLDAAYARLVATRAGVVWDPRPAPEPGVRMAFVRDREGNLIELLQHEKG